MKRALSLFLLVSAVLWAQEPGAPVPVDQEPMHHLYLANEYVRVFKVEVPVGGRTLLHQHDRDYLFVVLGDADIINARQGAPAMEQKLKDGDTAYAKGGFAHVAINHGLAPFRNVTIEVVKPKPEPNAAPAEQLVGAGMSTTWMVDNERAHAELIELAPGAAQPPHEHRRPHLVVFLTDGSLQNDTAGKAKADFTVQQGDVAWVGDPVPTHTLRNRGAKRVRWVMIEIK